MPRIRTVKPEFATNEQAVSCSRDARLTYILLCGHCDDNGVIEVSPKSIRIKIFPGDNDIDDSRMIDLLNELIDNDLLILFSYNNKNYLLVNGWGEISSDFYQNINRPQKSKYFELNVISLPNEKKFIDKETYLKKPFQKNVIENSVSTHQPFTDKSLNTHGAITAGKERKGKEGIGGEGSMREGGIFLDSGDHDTEQIKNLEQKKASVAPNGTTSRNNLEQTVNLIFDHWRKVMNHPNAKLDPKRRKIILGALKLKFSVEELCQAITGCSYTPHNRGENAQKQRYDGLHIIFENAHQIERFIDNFNAVRKKDLIRQEQNRPPTEEERRQELEAWERQIQRYKKPAKDPPVIPPQFQNLRDLVNDKAAELPSEEG